MPQQNTSKLIVTMTKLDLLVEGKDGSTDKNQLMKCITLVEGRTVTM